MSLFYYLYLADYPLSKFNDLNKMIFKMFSMLLSAGVLISCTENDDHKYHPGPLEGTWKLLSATTVENGTETFSDFTKGQEMIKIINATHFSFLKHDLKLNAEGKNNFDAGGGRYKLSGDDYIEFLDFYNDKNWEGKTFIFKVTIKKDTLIQTGIEKIENAGINRTITEKYIKLKNN